MDASVWIGAVFGLAGTALGGGLSIWAGVVSQRQQSHAARDLVIAERVDAAADSAVRGFFQVKQHLQKRPDPRNGSTDPAQALWRATYESLIDELETFLLALRNKPLRLRLLRVANYLTMLDEMTHTDLGGHAVLPRHLCEHALNCLGAFIRDEPLPPENEAMTFAEGAYDAYQAILDEVYGE